MWNKIACNRLVELRFQEKAQQRLQNIKKNHKSPYNIKQLSKSLTKSFNAKAKALQSQRNWEIDRENENMYSRIKEIKRTGSMKTTKAGWDKSYSIKTIISNNKRRVEQLKQKSIQYENKRLLNKIARTDSSLKKLRMRTSLNSSFEKQKIKSILFVSNSENVNIIKRNVPKLKSISKAKTEQAETINPIDQYNEQIFQQGPDEKVKESKDAHKLQEQIVQQF